MRIKNIVKVVTGIGLAVLLSGCVQPQVPYNPANKGIVFLDGKPYRVPYGTKYVLLKNNPKICKKGEVLWIEENLFKSKELYENRSDQYWIDFIKKEHQKGRIGCEKPLTDKEYHYYLNQQNQQAANARAMVYYNAATAPKRTYNYNYTTMTGTMFHYGF